MSAQKQKKVTLVVESFLETPLQEAGYEIVAIDFFHGKEGKVLRFILDREQGLSSEHCVKAHRLIQSLMESDGISELKYQEMSIEVRSPGLNRVLRKQGDFDRFKGKKVQVQLEQPLQDRPHQRSYTGTLEGLVGENVVLIVENEKIVIPWNQIQHANIVYAFKS